LRIARKNTKKQFVKKYTICLQTFLVEKFAVLKNKFYLCSRFFKPVEV
jgi:hypothetical protein